VEVDALAYGFIFEITPAHKDLANMREIHRDNFKGDVSRVARP
jgi:hypothetical protein